MAKKRAKRYSMPAGDKRREPREEVTDGTVRISGETWPLKDWSRTGFLAKPCTAEFKIDDELDITLSVPIPRGRLEFSCPAVIVRVDRDKQEVAGTYSEVDAATRVIIERHFGVDSARIRNLLDGAGTPEQGVAMLSTVFPNLGTAEILALALDVYHEHLEGVQQTLDGLKAMKMVMGRAPKELNTRQKLQFLAERGDREAAGLLFRLRGGVERRLSDQVKNAIDQAVRHGRDDIAEQLLLSHEGILKQEAARAMKRREEDKNDSRAGVH